jgi:WD40 repeat protein
MEETGGEEKMKAGKSMAPALIAAHPDGSCVVVAVGAALRIFNLLKEEPVQVQDDTQPAGHGDAIRAVAFDLHNSLFASVGDDKLVKLWDATAWTCIKTVYGCPPPCHWHFLQLWFLLWFCLSKEELN